MTLNTCRDFTFLTASYRRLQYCVTSLNSIWGREVHRGVAYTKYNYLHCLFSIVCSKPCSYVLHSKQVLFIIQEAIFMGKCFFPRRVTLSIMVVCTKTFFPRFLSILYNRSFKFKNSKWSLAKNFGGKWKPLLIPVPVFGSSAIFKFPMFCRQHCRRKYEKNFIYARKKIR